MAVTSSNSSVKNILNQLRNNLCNVYGDKYMDKYMVYVEYDHNNGNVKWNGSLKMLKNFVTDLFGEKGKWICPGGRAKSFRCDQVSITWYPHKKSLEFQGEVGTKLKDMFVNMGGTNITSVCENTTLQSAAIDQENFDQIIGSVTDIKSSVEQICRAMKKLDNDVAGQLLEKLHS